MSHLLADVAVVPFLRGRWQIERTLTDRSAAMSGSFTGVADFTQHASGLTWQEAGELSWPTHQGAAGRRLEITACSTEPRLIDVRLVDVRFGDGRLFHQLDLSTGRCDVVHECGLDRYVGSFVVTSPDEWHTTWDVDGPAKSITIASTYRH
ncbi:MAG: hypothetical protein QOJ62_2777 [Actinomycetota bacterium]|nr:hypothetical protein [Actinomycetota bacterium]